MPIAFDSKASADAMYELWFDSWKPARERLSTKDLQMRLKFEKDRNKKSVSLLVIADHINIGRITLKSEENWRVRIDFKGSSYQSFWPSLDQAQNEVRRIIGK